MQRLVFIDRTSNICQERIDGIGNVIKQHTSLSFFEILRHLVLLLLDLKLVITEQFHFTNTQVGTTQVESEKGADFGTVRDAGDKGGDLPRGETQNEVSVFRQVDADAENTEPANDAQYEETYEKAAKIPRSSALPANFRFYSCAS